MIETDALEGAMVAELSLPTNNSTNNNLKIIQMKAPKLKSALLKISNRYAELKRSFREGDTTRPAANKFIRESLILELIKADPDDAPVTLESNDDLDPMVRLAMDTSELKRFNPTQSALLKSLADTGSVIAYAPILPLCKPYLLRDRLTAQGIKNSVFEGYTILDRQLVVGISNTELTKKINAYRDLSVACDELKKMGKAAEKLSKDPASYYEAIKKLKAYTLGVVSQLDSNLKITKLGTALRNMDFSVKRLDTVDAVASAVYGIAVAVKELRDDFEGPTTAESLYDKLIKSASKMVGKPLIAVANPHLALNASWLWLISPKELGMITKSALGGHCAITKWGLAFSK